jgi:hypothetical protein
MVYLANKQNGDDEYVGLDWRTGAVKARWPFPDDSRHGTPMAASPACWKMGTCASEARSP